MQFTNILLASLAGLTAAAPTLVDREIPNNEVRPWEITSASSRSSRGAKYGITITLNNPNDYKLQRMPHGTVKPEGYAIWPKFTATCDWSWSGTASTPYGIETVCTTVATAPMDGNLTMTLRPGQGKDVSVADYAVDIKETRADTLYLQEYIRVWEGKTAFLRGDNLNVICGSGGACEWSLSPTKQPLFIKQELTKSAGSCEKAPVGSC
jgi:hypothetical protein